MSGKFASLFYAGCALAIIAMCVVAAKAPPKAKAPAPPLPTLAEATASRERAALKIESAKPESRLTFSDREVSIQSRLGGTIFLRKGQPPMLRDYHKFTGERPATDAEIKRVLQVWAEDATENHASYWGER